MIDPNTRERGWIQTFTGRKFYPLSPRAEDVAIEDVAHGLANSCRYGGHSKTFYSVAQHCVLVSQYLWSHRNCTPAPALALSLAGLLHDSAEAYIGDMVRPLKHQPEMAEFRKAESAIELAVNERFGIDMPLWHSAVKRADDRILVDEIYALMCNPSMYTDALRGVIPLGIEIKPWDPQLAEELFLHRFHMLTGVM